MEADLKILKVECNANDEAVKGHFDRHKPEDHWNQVYKFPDITEREYTKAAGWNIPLKPFTEMTAEELRAFIRDPYGPDYKGNIELAQFELFKRRRHE